MKLMILLTLLYSTLSLAQENKTFSGSFEASATLTMGATACYGRYLMAPITELKPLPANAEAPNVGGGVPVGLPHRIWMATSSEADCEKLRFEFSQRLLSTVVTFEIEGSSYWQTDGIGGGCVGHRCQSYVTVANLTGNFQGIKISDIFHDGQWLGHWPYQAPAPVPNKPRPHCHPMALICDRD